MRKWSWIALALLAAGCSSSSRQVVVSAPEKALRATRHSEIRTPIEPAVTRRIVGPVLPPELLIPAGTELEVRVEEPLNTRRNRSGDFFWATLVAPVVVDGATVVPAGTRVTGRIAAARTEGNRLAIELDSITVAGRLYRVHTNVIERGDESGRHFPGFASALHVLSNADRTGDTAEAAAPKLPVPPASVAADSLITFALAAPLKM